jgi:hypothetical protein
MATPSSPSNQSGPSSRDLAQSIKQLIEDQGDYNNLLKNALKDANKMDGVYKRIQARIESMNKDSINIKRVSAELYSLKQKEVIARKNAADIEKELSDNTRRDIKQRQTLNTLLKSTSDTQTKLRVMKQMQVMDAKLEANLELKALDIAKQGIKIAQDEVKAGEKSLSIEKEIRKQVGFTGAAFKFLADKIGVGESLQEDMVQNARRLNEEGKKFGIFDKIGLLAKAGLGALTEVFRDPLAFAAAWKAVSAGFDKLGSAFAKLGGAGKGLSGDSSDVVSKLASPISGLVKNIPLVGGLIGGMVDGFASMLDLIVGVDNVIVKAGRNLGMTSAQARQLNRHFQDISLSQGNVFVTSKKMLESYSELAGQLEVNNKLSDEALQTNIMLKDFAGLELDTRAKIAEVGKISGKGSEGVVKSVLAQVKGLERATGVQLNYQKILKEVSSLSGVLGLQFSKYPAQLTKSLLTIKAMGMDMKQLDSIADSFLDIESSISKEMEAQILTGKDINLNKARELFLNNDLAGAAAEINKHVGSSADFLKMNRIQAQSMAEAMGMSRDQMADMLQKQELYSKLGAKGTENAREMYQLALKKYGTEKEMAAALGEQAYQSMVQASTQEKLMAFVEKIKQSVVDFIERSKIIEKVEAFVTKLTNPDTIKGIVGTIKNAIADFIAFSGELLADVARFVSHLPFTDKSVWQSRADTIQGTTAGMANNIRAMGGDFGAMSVNQPTPQAAAAQQAGMQQQNKGFAGAQTITLNNITQLDNKIIAQSSKKVLVEQADGDKNRAINPYG